MMILVARARGCINISTSSARSLCFRRMELFRIRDSNNGFSLCALFSAWASPIAVRLRTRLEEAPLNALRQRTFLSMDIEWPVYRLQELYRDAFVVMTNHAAIDA